MHGFALENKHILAIIRAWGHHCDDSYGSHWLQHQRKRGGHLVHSKMKKLSSSRSGKAVRVLAFQWADDMAKLWTTEGIVGHAVIGYDETRLVEKIGKGLTIVRITAANYTNMYDILI